MRLRTYTVSQKYVKNKHGDIGVYKKRIKKWIKSSQPYKPRKRGLQKLSIHSTRFGFLDLYNRKEQQELVCPSGYSISQCFNVLRKLWYAYRRAIGTEKDIDKMKKYAKAIQDVQKDMGIRTASFPHLGLYGDALILNAKNDRTRIFENQSALRKKQEEYELRHVKNAKIQETLQKPNKLNGEAIVTVADDVFPYEKQDNEVTVPQLLEPDEEKEEVLTLVDNIPFRKPHRRRLNRKGVLTLVDNIPYRRPHRRRLNRKGVLTLVDNIPYRRPHRRRLNRKDESTLTIPDDVFPYEKQDNEVTVPQLLEPDEEKEEVLTLVDNIPYRRPHRRRLNRKDESTLTIPDDEIPEEELDAEIEDTVSPMLEPEGDEKILVFSDNIPFRS
jgi:hypothetical protein